MQQTNLRSSNEKNRAKTQIRLVKFALRCVAFNLDQLQVGVNTTADKYLEILREKYNLTGLLADAMLILHGTTFDEINFTLHSSGDHVTRGHELRDRGSC